MKIIAKNKRARYDYELKDTFNAGISLLGSEVKAIKEGNVSLDGTYITIDKNNNAQLLNMNVSQHGSYKKDHDSTRTRQLLLNKNEIKKLKHAIKLERMTVVPTILFIGKKGFIKIEIATAKGKQKKDKRESQKQKDAQRETKSY